MRAMLDVVRGPEPFSLGIVTSVEERVEGFQQNLFVLLCERIVHVALSAICAFDSLGNPNNLLFPMRKQCSSRSQLVAHPS